MTRSQAIDAFLAAHGHAGAARAPLAGDASARRYERVAGRVLMDAPPGSGEDVAPFLGIAARLADRGLSVPRIEAADAATGLVLMEDLGDALYSRHAREAPGDETALYVAAAEATARMQTAPCGDLPDYVAQMPDLACLALDWYAPEGKARRDDLRSAMADALDALPGRRVFVHRDWHADNLIWLPGRDGAARVGILDFQDAMVGLPDYDIASLLHDARRVVSDAARTAAWRRWLDLSGRSGAEAGRGFATASAQRGLRILGVFARLCLRDGKAGYPAYIPRTWELLQRDLAHPALKPLARVVAEAIPAPDAARLDAIRARAGTGVA